MGSAPVCRARRGVSILLTGAPDSDRSLALTMHIDMEEKNSLSGGSKSRVLKKIMFDSKD